MALWEKEAHEGVLQRMPMLEWSTDPAQGLRLVSEDQCPTLAPADSQSLPLPVE